MKNLKAINMTESNFEKELKEIFEKYNIEPCVYDETLEEEFSFAISVEHKGRSYVVTHIDVFDKVEENTPHSYQNEYFQLYINGRKASGANNFDWFKYNMSNDYQIVPKIVQEKLVQAIIDEELKVIEYYRNQNQ